MKPSRPRKRAAIRRVSGRDASLLAILSLALLLRTYHFAYPFWDYFASRQTFNLMVVRSYLARGISLFRPTVDWLTVADPSRPSYFCAEFPWLHALAAIELRVLPLDDWSTRFIPIAFSLAGIWWLYSLTRRIAGEPAGRFAALALAVLPFSVFFARAFMSDMPALSLATGALDAFCSWLKTRRSVSLVLFVLLGSLAALAKPQTAVFGLVVLYLGIVEFRLRLPAQWRLYLAAVVIVVPTALWLHHAGELSRLGGPQVIGSGLIGRSLHLWLHTSAWREQWNRLFHAALGPLALALVALGLFIRPRNSDGWLFHVWFLASALFLFLIPEAIIGWNDYYLLLLVPPSAGLIGIWLGNLYAHRTGRMIAFVLSVALVISSILSARPLFRSDELHYHLGRLLNRLTQPGDLIVTSAGGSPDPLYFAERPGWEAGKYDLSRLEELSAWGKVFAIADPDAMQNNAALMPLLDRRFRRLTQENPANPQAAWPIWELRPALPHNFVDPKKTSGGVDFGGKVASTGVFMRELIGWPASFEVTYGWRCLSKIDAGLRVFAHLTTLDGRTVFQQDHWPPGGQSATTQWSAGDTLQERYVLVLPGDLPPGRYQLRVGWFDPAGGQRLPIVSGGSDGEDRAILAEFGVEDKPVQGWFSVE
jgi:hypothetical protein